MPFELHGKREQPRLKENIKGAVPFISFPLFPLDGDAKELDADRLVGSQSCLGDGSAREIVSADDLAALLAASSRIAAAMARVRQVDGQVGLLHADLAPANWVFHGTEPRPFDFDEFGRGFYLFDLLGVLWSHVSWEKYTTFRDHLFAGYEQVLPLPRLVKDSADLSRPRPCSRG